MERTRVRKRRQRASCFASWKPRVHQGQGSVGTPPESPQASHGWRVSGSSSCIALTLYKQMPCGSPASVRKQQAHEECRSEKSLVEVLRVHDPSRAPFFVKRVTRRFGLRGEDTPLVRARGWVRLPQPALVHTGADLRVSKGPWGSESTEGFSIFCRCRPTVGHRASIPGTSVRIRPPARNAWLATRQHGSSVSARASRTSSRSQESSSHAGVGQR